MWVCVFVLICRFFSFFLRNKHENNKATYHSQQNLYPKISLNQIILPNNSCSFWLLLLLLFLLHTNIFIKCHFYKREIAFFVRLLTPNFFWGIISFYLKSVIMFFFCLRDIYVAITFAIAVVIFKFLMSVKGDNTRLVM